MNPDPSRQREDQDSIKKCPRCDVVLPWGISTCPRCDGPELKRKGQRLNWETFIGLSLYALPWALIIFVNETPLNFFTLYLGCLLAVVIFLALQRVRLISAMWILTTIIIISAIFIPHYIKYSRRVRTTDATDHARMICNAVTDWVAAPNLSDGDLVSYPVPPVTTVGRDGHSFQEQFPAEANWLDAVDKTSSGVDPYYGFTLDLSNPSNPAVIGTAWSGQDEGDLMGVIVQAGGTGVESGEDLSGCKSNVEKYSDRF